MPRKESQNHATLSDVYVAEVCPVPHQTESAVSTIDSSIKESQPTIESAVSTLWSSVPDLLSPMKEIPHKPVQDYVSSAQERVLALPEPLSAPSLTQTMIFEEMDFVHN